MRRRKQIAQVAEATVWSLAARSTEGDARDQQEKRSGAGPHRPSPIFARADEVIE